MSLPPHAEPVTRALLRGWPVPEPDGVGDKHSRGTVMIAGGATSTPGAVLLAGLAALRVGAGRLQVATVGTTSVALAVALPEAMVLGLAVGADGSLAPACAQEVAHAAASAQGVVVGPGLLGRDATRELLRDLLGALGPETLVVLDAVAVCAVGDEPSLIGPVCGRVVLTPNSGELCALLDGDAEPGPATVAEASRRYDAVVACGGWVAAPDGRLWHDEAGGVGLGTSGSGDVLAGAVGGLLARGADPAQAAVWGRHLHAASGDRLGGPGFLARELLDELPRVLADMSG